VLEILKIKDYHSLHTLHLVHRILLDFAPPNLTDLLSLRSNTATSERSTRAHKLALHAPHVCRKVPEKSFSVKAYRLWNNLETHLNLCTNVSKFNSVNFENLLKLYDS
jgi:hypothetical protein